MKQNAARHGVVLGQGLPSERDILRAPWRATGTCDSMSARLGSYRKRRLCLPNAEVEFVKGPSLDWTTPPFFVRSDSLKSPSCIIDLIVLVFNLMMQLGMNEKGGLVQSDGFFQRGLR